ncbi:MAG: alpha/beta hydrolase [Anaerolineae bacterium]
MPNDERSPTPPRHPNDLPHPAQELALAAWDLVAAGAEVAFHARAPRAVRDGARFAREHPHAARDVRPTPGGPALDAFWPGQGASCPLLIFCHGGGWIHYRKELYTAVAAHLVPRGWAVVLPDYTAYPRATYRQMADEVAAAVAWTLDRLPELGADPRRVYLAGHSAGAHLTALISLDKGWLASHGHDPSELAGYVGLSGVYDLVVPPQPASNHRGIELLNRVFDGMENLPAASPLTHVRPGAPRTLLIHGAHDPYLPPDHARAFAEALRQVGAPCELRIYRDVGHSDLILDPLSGKDDRLWRDLEAFAKRHPGA